ncbi:hypothetical protein NDU88_009639 [Pleurodeles waltl]|uniref:Uncharacterized protein n=1 Tax=Pleurodeles waltl TaxID=8319 RepID=A0AAV7RYY7_PLEWA|nr:hypothetical protein NDU88_009639 [Pleurodeles waltl]
MTRPTQRLARGSDGNETRMHTQRGAERSSGHSGCTLCAGTEGSQRRGRERRRATDVPLHAIGAQSDGQLKTPDEHQGLIAEHAQGGKARLRSNYGRGRGRRPSFLGTAA